MSSIIKTGLFLIIIFAAMLLSYPTHADEFLTKSPALYNAGIKLYVGENQQDAVAFHIRDIGYVKESALFVLTSAGARPLAGKLSSIDLQNECGDPGPGIGFKKKGYDGFLIAVGKDIDKYIKFYPAQRKPTDSYKSCMSESPKEQLNIMEYSSPGLDGAIQQVRWKKSLTKEEKIDYLHCPDIERVVINLQDKDGKCLEITNSAIDCDGMATTGFDLKEFLGVLKIEYRSRKEVWLLWNAPGYEGDGIYAIEINDIPEKQRNFEEWLVYNGC